MRVETSGGEVWAVVSRFDSDLFVVSSGFKDSIDSMMEGIELAGNAEGKEVKLGSVALFEGEWCVWVPRETFAMWLSSEALNFVNYESLEDMREVEPWSL